MSDLSRCLIYGAYGYTGELIVRLVEAQGLKPILAGRNASKLAPLVERSGLPSRVFGLDDPAALDAGLADIDVVLHCAGPFSRTSKPMVDACIRTKTHYLDITGEIPVFEACAARSAEAEAAGVMLMPGVGFDIVPSDCLAQHLKGKLPTATHLSLAFAPIGGATSHGTATTMVENLGQPNAVRRDGRITPIRMGKLSRKIDFGRGPAPTLSIPWGDVSTAFHSTGIPNIEVFIKLPGAAVTGAWIGGFMGPLMGSSFVKGIAQKRVEAAPAGPDDEARRTGFTLLWGRATDGTTTVEARQRVPEGYTLTALTGLDIAIRAAGGAIQAGYRTPSMVYGADYILGFEGVERTDV
jgi:short subunit dehydrogenase-like uncharacterized protein